jgi:hypothetical protein
MRLKNFKEKLLPEISCQLFRFTVKQPEERKARNANREKEKMVKERNRNKQKD